MPYRIASPCSQPGCPHRKPCPVHRAQRARDTRPSAARRGYDGKWRQIRAAFLKRYPDCVVCGEPAQEVDHIVALEAGGSNEWSNLQAMCKSHHSQKTNRVDGGFGGNRFPGKETIKILPMSGKTKTSVTIVYGPPGAGKTTYVKEHALWGDLIIDFDALYAALSGLAWYEKPAALMPFVCEARDAVLNRLYRDSEVRHAWLITSEPKAKNRHILQVQFNAKLVFIETSSYDCLRRIANDPRRDVKDWEEIVNSWWSEYTSDEDRESSFA